MNQPAIEEFQNALDKHAESYAIQLNQDAIALLSRYYDLLLHWNARLHLVAPCSPTEFATRHVLESLMTLPYLAGNAHVTDVGSGAGLPIIPCLILRGDIQADLVDSSAAKAVFLREALNSVHASQRSQVFANRFEDLPGPKANVVTCRALDRFNDLFPALLDWTINVSRLVLFGGATLQGLIEKTDLIFSRIQMPKSERRFLFVIDRSEDS